MRWVTRANLHIDRTSCPWLIRKYIDPAAEFVFVPSGTDPSTVDGHTFDMRGAEYSHGPGSCTFETMLARHGLTSDPALVEMGRIIRDADVPPSRSRRPEAAGLAALMTGFQLSVRDDDEKLRLTTPVYDALYAYCREQTAAKPRSQATPRPRLNYRKRFIAHVDEGDA